MYKTHCWVIYSVVKKLIKQISNLKKDVVFVGGVALVHYGIKDTAKDIDIVVNDLNGLEVLGDIQQFQTNSVMSKSGNRAFINIDGIIIDVFINDDLPEYIDNDGVKYGTTQHLIEFLEDLINKTDGFEKNRNEMKLEMIINKLNNK